MIYWILFIITEITRHYFIIEKKKQRPNYGSSFCWRAFWGFVVMAASNPYVDPVMEILELTPFIIFQATSFWVLFDLGLNISRGKALIYKGQNSGWLDKLPIGIYATLKLIAFGVMLYTIKILL